jgi:predicted outer membrane repeat protein
MFARVRAVLVAIAALVAVALMPAQPAYAADISVTTTDDVVAADGVTSLREAVAEANAAGEASTITLPPGTYTLDDDGACAAGDEDGNATGDLDYTAAQPLTITGAGATIAQTCAGQRVFEATSGGELVTLVGLTVSGGEGFGAAIVFRADLVLTDVTVAGNDSGGAGAVVINEDMGFGPSLTVTGATIGPNTGTGLGISFGAVTITDTTVAGNTASGVALTDGALEVTGSLFEDNGANGVTTSAQGNGLFTFTDSISRDNAGTGVGCNNCGDLRVIRSTVQGNDGGGLNVILDLDEASDSLTTLIEDSSVVGNARTGDGGALVVTAPMPEAGAAQVIVSRSTLAGNSATGRGGAIAAAQAVVRVTNSTLSANSADTAAGAIWTDAGDVHLQHATLVENSAPTAAHIDAAADLLTFGSIIAAGSGGQDCQLAGATASTGYNVGGDTSCGLTGPGDVQNVADPVLGPLQDNGGPTQTRVPLAGSPALSRIPVADCVVQLEDQRGTVRPAGLACESGAVEVAAGGGGLAGTGASLTMLVVTASGLVVAGALLVLLMAALRRRRSAS